MSKAEKAEKAAKAQSLNPYSTGRYSMSGADVEYTAFEGSLNPYSTGRYSMRCFIFL